MNEVNRAELNTQIKLIGLGGTIRSKPIDVPKAWIGGPIFFAHVNHAHRLIVNWQDLPATYLDGDIKRLRFEMTGRTWYRKSRQTLVYEYELTEI